MTKIRVKYLTPIYRQAFEVWHWGSGKNYYQTYFDEEPIEGEIINGVLYRVEWL